MNSSLSFFTLHLSSEPDTMRSEFWTKRAEDTRSWWPCKHALQAATVGGCGARHLEHGDGVYGLPEVPQAEGGVGGGGDDQALAAGAGYSITEFSTVQHLWVAQWVSSSSCPASCCSNSPATNKLHSSQLLSGSIAVTTYQEKYFCFY